jgi:hypothetical protein
MRRTWIGSLLVGLIGLTAGGTVGCAQERAPISRVQADALAKSFFVGMKLADDSDNPEFYARGTIVDVGYGAAQDGLFTSSYAQPVSRIRWHIQQDMLIGRISYERINGSDGKGTGKASSDGVIAYAYPITAHFDIRRDYNPTTGEESNTIVENSTDRTWDQREYMRVDWSRNMATDAYDFDTLSAMGLGGVKYEAMAYYVNNPEDPDAPHFDATTGYFDVTNKAFAKPELIDLPEEWGGGQYPSCYLDNDVFHGSGPSGSCDPVELTLRQSFRRVENTDYEAQDWDGYRFQSYGAFTEDRKGYARNYGMSDDKWHRFIARYNIWERSHAYQDEKEMTGAVECFTPTTTPIGVSPHRDLQHIDTDPTHKDTFGKLVDGPDGTEDECSAVGAGSRCDEFTQKCTLPFVQRKEKPVVWYYSNGSNPEFFDGTSWAAHEWDVALRGSVMTSRYAECNRAGGEATCKAACVNTDADVQATCEAKCPCTVQYPMYTGQMSDNEDATMLAREVDDCRHGIAYGGKDCEGVADTVGAARGFSPGIIAIAKMREMVVLCHSPVEANDPADCAAPENRLPAGVTAAQCGVEREKQLKNGDGNADLLAKCKGTDEKPVLNVRMGDLRYHQVNGIVTPQTPSPWGIMVDAVDPLTGEKVQASINVWTHVNDLWSQGVVDTSRYIKGEIPTSEITDGTYVRDWVNANRSSSGNGSLPTMDADEVKKRLAGFAGVDTKAWDIAGEKAANNPDIQALAQRVKAEVKTFRADANQPGVMSARYEARRKHALNTPMEAELITHAMLEAGDAANLPPTDAVLNAVSPLRGANPSVQRKIRTFKEMALADRGACILQEAPAPFAVTGLADVLEEKFGKFNPADDKGTQFARGERMRKFVAQRAQYAVIVHEMGHSIGLRHNFVSSYDAWGYRPQYWQLRTKNGTVTGVNAKTGAEDPKTYCTQATTDSESCVGPRYFDPVSENERQNMIWMFMQSSVMDYAGETTQDLIGLGAYDYAAAKMFYGDVAAVFADPSYNVGAAKNAPRAKGMLSLMDNFGGITGIQPQIGNGKKISASEPGVDDIHYSKLQGEYELIKNCKEVVPETFKPASWNEERDGIWHPTLDGHIVKVDGKYTKCEEQPVDYVNYGQLRFPLPTETTNSRTSEAVENATGRVRVPYGFATDRWADLGNLSVYRHDNGADPYELFDFLITQQEVGHIFYNYRRNRTDFSIRSAANRTLERYNEKMRDGAKGLSLYVSIYKDFALEAGFDYDANWASIVHGQFPENILASGIAFDHIARMQQRPEPGPHQKKSGDTVYRSSIDTIATPGATQFLIPNGATGYYGNVSFGGKPLENQLAEDKGEYSTEYNINAGDYYDKVYNPMLMAESVDNFISASRTDYLDGRYRAVSVADLFPEGYRRWIANNLTGDDELKGAHLAADTNGKPLLDTGYVGPDPDGKKYPAQGIGWTSWWPTTGPEACFPSDGSVICSAYGDPNGGAFNPKAPAKIVTIDPQVGWEQQKFLIASTLQYLPENAQQYWLDNLRLWELGADSDPGFANRIEFHDPSGKVYIAKTFGTEVIFGKTVQKGIAARMVEWANVLLNKAYVTTTVTKNGVTWYEPVIDATTGKPLVKYDSTLQGGPDTVDCDSTTNVGCTCSSNRSCVLLSRYVELPFFLRQALTAYGLADPSMKGLF